VRAATQVDFWNFGLTSKSLKGLFLAHRRELHAYLSERLRDPEVAADLTQETFLRYAEQGGAAIVHDRSYLYRTARNLAIDHVRQAARQRTTATAHEDMEHIQEERPSLEQAADARRKLERLWLAVDQLPERTRSIFMLVKVEELSYAQVAQRLGISESSVQKHLAKALHHVMQQVRP